jgi:hypothetical protein
VKERRGRVSGAVGGIAEGVAAAVRRRQQDREPRVLLYDAAGNVKAIAEDRPERESLLEAAEGLIELAEPVGDEPESGE